MSRVFLLVVFLVSLSIPPPPAYGGNLSYVVGMQQRRDLRRRARLSHRFPVPSAISSSSASSAVPRTDLGSSARVSPAPRLPAGQAGSSPSASEVGSSSILDPPPATDVRADIPLLGSVTPILGSVRIFPEHEPVDIRTIFVDFIDAPLSIDSLLLYDGDRRSLGRATLDTGVSGGKRFTLKLLGNTFVIPKREERSVYVRAFLKTRDAGGRSGEIFQLKEFRVEGDGVWSNEPYGKTLTETFPTFQAARARFTSVANTDALTGSIPLGPSQRIAVFRFTGERSDNAAELRVTDLTFQVGASADISLSNAILRGRDADVGHACTVGSVTITCSSVPASHGVISEGGRVLELFADVTSTGTVSSPILQITLNNPGTVDTAGHITWTDGTTIFTWVQFDQPVVRGIRLR